jgi:catechol 2,3-dioxygenase-like lactoylglutathione lyase family enzyme
MIAGTAAELRVIQLGMNTSDMAGSLRLFSEAFGFLNGGGRAMWGSTIGLQGLPPDSRAIVWWMVGSQSFFQLELLQHTRPAQRSLSDDWSPADHGWNRVGIAVPDFSACLAALAANGISTLTPPLIENGIRRVAFRDPFIGAIFEIIEKQVAQCGRAQGPEIVYASSSVSDLDSARKFYSDVIGLEVSDTQRLHNPNHAALWGLAGSNHDSFMAQAGDIYIEVVRYRSPVGRARPADYQVSDQGIVNVAFGSREPSVVFDALARLKAAGYVPPSVYKNGGIVSAYIIDREREVELSAIPAELDAALGFSPALPFFR